MKIAFVILHYRDIKNTKACLESICEMKPEKDVQINLFVIDNCSPDIFPQDTVHCALGEASIVRNSNNLGYSGGMNSGITLALDKGADYVVVVNNDTVFDKAFLTSVTHAISKNKHAMLVPKIYFYKGTEFHHDRYKEQERGKVIWYAGGRIDWDNVLASHVGVDEVDNGQYNEEKETSFATGCCIIIPKEVIEKVGMFDNEYYLYFEDIDLSMRVRRAGYGVWFVPDAVLWHKNAKSSGGPGSHLQDYFIARNRLLFGFRYASLRAKLALLRESSRILFSGRMWQKRGVIDFYLGRFGKGSYPIR